jgi:hypothetical protein
MRIQNLFALGLLSLASLASIGCAAHTAETAEASDEADTLGSTSTYFIATHIDTRRCASPMCGGVFVKRVNAPMTKCSDGTTQSECRAYQTDLSALGLDQAESDKIGSTFNSGHVLVRGSLVTRTEAGHAVPYLVATEAWVANALSAPTGTFYSVKLNGVRCIAAPCNDIHEAKLNSSASRDIAGVDLTKSGANTKQITAGEEALTSGLLVVGSQRPVTGPGGTSSELVASEFYTRVVHTVTPGAIGTFCGGIVGTQCDTGLYCDVNVTNACNGADLGGTCKSVPDICYLAFIPVCGCDGLTYTNDCKRLAAKVQLAHTGACN